MHSLNSNLRFDPFRAMTILLSHWRRQFASFLAKVKRRLRVAAPYYGDDAIRTILDNTNKRIEKSFILALSDRGVEASSQSIAAIKRIEADPLSRIRFIRNLHAKVLIADEEHAVVTSANLTGAALDKNVEVGVFIDEPKLVKELIPESGVRCQCCGQKWPEVGVFS